jgi:peptidoglycan/LPS O-acetylase OafA/YrhL
MKEKLEGIQVVRAIAALSVVIFHSKLILIRFDEGSKMPIAFFHDKGDIGVPIFFVISGFIISHVIQRPNCTFIKFVIRRFWRLWPFYVICTLFYSLIYLLQRDLPASELGLSYGSYLKSLFFFPQFDFPVLHPGWSLEHEVIFYLYASIFGVLLSNKKLLFFMFILSIASVLWWFVLPDLWNWHLLDPANIYFFIGVLTHFLWSKKKATKSNYFKFLLLGLLILLCGVYLTEYSYLIKITSLKRNNNLGEIFLVGLGSGVCIYGLVNLKFNNFFWRKAVWLGDRSYSLYLSHFLLIPVFQIVHREHIKWPAYAAGPLCLFFIIFSIILCWIFFEIFEKRFINPY